MEEKDTYLAWEERMLCLQRKEEEEEKLKYLCFLNNLMAWSSVEPEVNVSVRTYVKMVDAFSGKHFMAPFDCSGEQEELKEC